MAGNVHGVSLSPGFIQTENDSESSQTDYSNMADNSGESSSTCMSVSLLDRLKSPSPAEISRPRKMKVNKPHDSGKRRCRGALASDPKSITASQRVQEFEDEFFIVDSDDNLFCQACQEQISLKRSIIRNHTVSSKHKKRKEQLVEKQQQDTSIATSLSEYNSEIHLKGETLSENHQAYRVRVVATFLKSGVPLSKIETFRELLEEKAYRLTDRRNMCDYIHVPFILKEESLIRQEIGNKYLSVTFDGTSRLGEALAVVLHFVDDDWQLQHRLIRCQMLSKALSGEEIAREVISTLSVTYGIYSHRVLATMRDRASANNVAMQTMKVMFPSLVDIGCFSHTIDRVGSYFKTTTLDEFTTT